MTNLRTLLSRIVLVSMVLLTIPSLSYSQESIAREWNELLLQSIRNDFARPTVHARNLFHISVAMYDGWAVFDPNADTFFLGKTLGDYSCPFDGIANPDDILAAQEECISFACFRLMSHRFQNQPEEAINMQPFYNQMMSNHGYDITNTSNDYQNGGPAELGNYLASELINFGFQDGANEINGYANQYYQTINDTLWMAEPGNPLISDPNRWQPLGLEINIDQGGNETSAPDFLSPEWGNVVPFSMSQEDMVTFTRDGDEYKVYHDPGPPPYLDPEVQTGLEDQYKWGNVMVLIWSSHLDPSDNVMIDISPGSIGNTDIDAYPTDFEDYDEYYDFFDGGDIGPGHDLNPATNLPYEPNMVPRGDYARVLAEFWADGPDSETPPGHWFEILNYVNSHPDLEKRWNGEGDILSDLEWDVKTYFCLGGTMHDVAVSAWGIKGWYDYVRPVSAIRYMAEKGQSSDEFLPNYDPAGLPLVPGYIEQIEPGDDLAGDANEFVGEIKVRTWRGPDYINNEIIDEAGVGWIYAKEWWPYQRPTFVTPPFAGYVSGHSTYSRAAADLFTLMTGDPFFPGGMGVFSVQQDQFLVFEDGPSQSFDLQWATYRDASDQTSLSRIWGGIHPPADDLPGRFIGSEIGENAYNFAIQYFEAPEPRIEELTASIQVVADDQDGETLTISYVYDQTMDTNVDPTITFPADNPVGTTLTETSAMWINPTTFEVVYDIVDADEELLNWNVQVTGAMNMEALEQEIYIENQIVIIDTKNPEVESYIIAFDVINESNVGEAMFMIDITFNESMTNLGIPSILFPDENPLTNSLSLNLVESGWIADNRALIFYDVVDADEELYDIDFLSVVARDQWNNLQVPFEEVDAFGIDTKAPVVDIMNYQGGAVTDAEAAMGTYTIEINFDEAMDMMVEPILTFPNENVEAAGLSMSGGSWLSDMSYGVNFDVLDMNVEVGDIDVNVVNATDANGNMFVDFDDIDALVIDTKNPTLMDVSYNLDVISDADESMNFEITFIYDEPMSGSVNPTIIYDSENPETNTLTPSGSSMWIDDFTFVAMYTISDANEELFDIQLTAEDATDALGNLQPSTPATNNFIVDTRNPSSIFLGSNLSLVSEGDVGNEMFELTIIFDEDMDQDNAPTISFPNEDPTSVLTLNSAASDWLNATTFQAVYNVENNPTSLYDIDVTVSDITDEAGNDMMEVTYEDYFHIDFAVSIDEQFNTAFNVYPNPVNEGEEISIISNNLSGLSVIRIFNTRGQLVLDQQVNLALGNTTQVATSNLASGSYLVQITSGENTEEQQLIIK